ncbi:MAG TPA: 2-C-methyl-D-erythritol 4-phosphate cytidylyltransferase [Candidatus Binatia bacterium]|nr:2-C-methyl-D-erythritol 4-phosphate cytidylyltransferase [Candidatus Binatia bacterium]
MNDTPAPRYWAVIAAAGGGARMQAGRPKQYLKLRGRALIEHSLTVFMDAPWIEGIVVVLAPGDEDFARLPFGKHWKLHTAAGGGRRAESVLAGLARVAELSIANGHAPPPYVLVHDAARPCITRDDLDRLKTQASDEQGGLLAIPVADTLKRAESSRCAATVERRELWRAQTPQMFRLDLLRRALEDCVAQGVDATDEARAMEAAGSRPRLVEGRAANLKVTFPDDLALAEFWLARQDNGR